MGGAVSLGPQWPRDLSTLRLVGLDRSELGREEAHFKGGEGRPLHFREEGRESGKRVS